MSKCKHCFAAGWLAAVLASLSIVAPPAGALEKVTLRLQWDHQFQFAGFYAARWQGYYEEAGLEVEILPAVTPERKIIQSMDEVAARRAEFGIGSGSILVRRDQGSPLVILGVIFQQSPVAFYARADSGLHSPADLFALRVARNPAGSVDVEFQSMLRLEGLDPEGVVPYPHEPALRHLAEGRVDVSPGFTLATPWEGRKLGLDLVSLRPSAYGVDFYGDTLVTHQNLIDNNPELVQRFVAASMKGWAYALENSDEIADRISAELPRVFPVGDTVGFNRFQAEEVKRLMLYPLVVPGHTNPNRWRRMHEFLKASGAVTGDFDAQALIYDPQARHHERDLFLRNVLTIGLGSLLVVALIVLLLNWGLRRTVARRTHDLQKSEAALANAQRVAHFGSWERDLRTGVTTWSDEIYRMFGYKPGTIDPGRERAFRHLHPDDLARATAALDDAVEAGVGYDMEYRIVRPDGEERIIHSRGETILDDAGRTTQLRGAMHDITERKQADTEIRLLNEELEQRVVERTAELRSAQDELVKQERLAALGQLTATVAHELRNPLATIRASHYAIQREISRTDSKIGVPMERIERTIDRCDQIIGELLEFSRHQDLRLGDWPADYWLAGVVGGYTPPHGVDIRLNLGVGEAMFGFDGDRLRQVIINLLDNACQAITDENGEPDLTGTVTVTTAIVDGRCEITVADTGCGIADDVMDRIFEPLFSTKGFGAGLGLPLVKRLVEQHGGVIRVATEVGAGTSFCVSLPMESAGKEAA